MFKILNHQNISVTVEKNIYIIFYARLRGFCHQIYLKVGKYSTNNFQNKFLGVKMKFGYFPFKYILFVYSNGSANLME